MESLEVKSSANQEIINAIKEIILSKYSILENRMDMLFDEDRVIGIHLHFIKDTNKKNNEWTHIYFMDGTSNGQSKTPESIDIEGLMNNETIFGVMEFLLEDHDVISDIYKRDKEIEIYFLVNMSDENMKGMGCYQIRLVLEFRKYPNPEDLLNYYFISIFRRFHKELQRTSFFEKEYQNYCINKKQEIINSLSLEDLHKMVGLFTNHDLCSILFSLPDERFFELYAELEEKEASKRKLTL